MEKFVPMTRAYARTEHVFAALAESSEVRRYRYAKNVASVLVAILALVLAYYVIRYLGTLPKVSTAETTCPSDVSELPIGRAIIIPAHCFS